jgi:uncharacterized protein with PIN domain
MNVAYFSFHAELRDFLVNGQHDLCYAFQGSPGIKDPVEALGVPHTEVQWIVVNGECVGFDYRLQHRDQVQVYPSGESPGVTPAVPVRVPPVGSAFVLDVNLGKLARRLRLCGLDACYRNDFSDRDVAELAARDRRIVLTRDRRLLHQKTIVHGYWVRATDPDLQLREVLQRFHLHHQVRPFHRCIRCNGEIRGTDKAAVLDLLEPLTRRYYTEFYRCQDCGKVYWKGSHYEHMRRRVERLTGVAPPPLLTAPGPDADTAPAEAAGEG